MMRSTPFLTALLALFLCAACGGEDADLDQAPRVETMAPTATTPEPSAPGTDTGTIREIPTEPATQVPATTTETRAAQSTTGAPEQRPASTPATRPSAPATQPVAPTPMPTPAQPAPSQPAPEPAPQPAPQPVPPTELPATETAPATSSKLPKTHTVDLGGTMHAPGMDNPVQRCGACHGKDLKGGRVGVSCLSCHEQKW